MRNVYEAVRFFYDGSESWDPVVSQELVEGFLRRQAWRGMQDQELRAVWRDLERLLRYTIYAEKETLDDISFYEYGIALEWIAEHTDHFPLTLPAVRRLFAVWIDFYQYVQTKRYPVDLDVIRRAGREIAGGDQLALPLHADDEGGVFFNAMEGMDFITEEMGDRLNGIIERLMRKIGVYFQREKFSADFNRAIYLYTGPFRSMPEEDADEFWLGFWDYFLFDYHLLSTDEKPLLHFQREKMQEMDLDERRILADLLNAKFTVFYVNKIVSNDWVECINLFTDEKLHLPLPDYGINDLKKVLLYGHLYTHSVVMLNYITSIEVSPILRKRIKEEVLRQKAIYEIQAPQATIHDFFDRHALVVRHTIDILVTLATVNVTSIYQIDRQFPVIPSKAVPNEKVADLLGELAGRYGFGLHDKSLLAKMWHDFYQLHPVVVRKPAVWAAAILHTFAHINENTDIVAGDLVRSVGISEASFDQNCRKIFEVLELQKFDPRYLTEEGFALSLFVF